MQTQLVTTKRVVVKQAYHDVLEKDGYDVMVFLNGHKAFTIWYEHKADADNKAKTLRPRVIPDNAELGLIGDKWCPLTSCNSIFA